jgi:hypothetical protein
MQSNPWKIGSPQLPAQLRWRHLPAHQKESHLSQFRFRFEPGYRITFIRALVIIVVVGYIAAFLLGLMIFAFLGVVTLTLQKLGWLDATILATHKAKLDGDIFLYVALPLLGLSALLLSFALSAVFRWLSRSSPSQRS